MLRPVIAIFVGSGVGALLRWWLAEQYNGTFPEIPPGTLGANLLGGYVIGLAIAFVASHPGISPEWRLFVITGFCGGLTTFSTLSAEIVVLLQQGEALWGLVAALVHFVGSVLMTLAGIGTVNWFRS